MSDPFDGDVVNVHALPDDFLFADSQVQASQEPLSNPCELSLADNKQVASASLWDVEAPSSMFMADDLDQLISKPCSNLMDLPLTHSHVLDSKLPEVPRPSLMASNSFDVLATPEPSLVVNVAMKESLTFSDDSIAVFTEEKVTANSSLLSTLSLDSNVERALDSPSKHVTATETTSMAPLSSNVTEQKQSDSPMVAVGLVMDSMAASVTMNNLETTNPSASAPVMDALVTINYLEAMNPSVLAPVLDSVTASVTMNKSARNHSALTPSMGAPVTLNKSATNPSALAPVNEPVATITPLDPTALSAFLDSRLGTDMNKQPVQMASKESHIIDMPVPRSHHEDSVEIDERSSTVVETEISSVSLESAASISAFSRSSGRVTRSSKASHCGLVQPSRLRSPSKSKSAFQQSLPKNLFDLMPVTNSPLASKTSSCNVSVPGSPCAQRSNIRSLASDCSPIKSVSSPVKHTIQPSALPPKTVSTPPRKSSEIAHANEAFTKRKPNDSDETSVVRKPVSSSRSLSSSPVKSTVCASLRKDSEANEFNSVEDVNNLESDAKLAADNVHFPKPSASSGIPVAASPLRRSNTIAPSPSRFSYSPAKYALRSPMILRRPADKRSGTLEANMDSRLNPPPSKYLRPSDQPTRLPVRSNTLYVSARRHADSRSQRNEQNNGCKPPLTQSERKSSSKFSLADQFSRLKVSLSKK